MLKKEDDQLQDDVIAELEWDPSVDHTDIGVAVTHGVVTLAGYVKSYPQKLAAERAVRRVAGVRALAEELKVRFASDPKTADHEIARRIVDMIDWRQSKVDDFVCNRAGTIHAIGPGLTVVEVQQNVDCTYRLYDYGRPRELHLDAGLKVANPGRVHDERDTEVDAHANRMLVNGPHFHLAHLAAPIDPTLLEQAAGELTFVPLSSGCRVAGEIVALGEAVLLTDPTTIAIDEGGRALLTWPA
jgi:hypothetical protein